MGRHLRSLGLFVIVVACTIAGARDSLADPAAEKLFQDGKTLMKQGKLAEACDRLARSQKLEPRAGTLLNLGACQELRGLTASAWETFVQAKTMALAAHDNERAAEASRRAEALKSKLAYLTITIPPDRAVEGLEVRRNGTLVDPAVWNVDVPIDPGDYELVVSARDHESWTVHQPIEAGKRATVVVEPLKKIATPARVVPAPPPMTATTTVASTAGTSPDVGLVKTIDQPAARARRWAVGAAVGESTSFDPTFGVRIIRNVDLSTGAIRGVASALYDNFNDDNTNGFSRSHQVLAGAGVEYVWLTRRFAFAAGAAAGLDLLFRNMSRGVDAAPWWGIRASPMILRLLDDQMELGLHLLGIQSTDRLAAFGLLAFDWYIR